VPVLGHPPTRSWPSCSSLWSVAARPAETYLHWAAPIRRAKTRLSPGSSPPREQHENQPPPRSTASSGLGHPAGPACRRPPGRSHPARAAQAQPGSEGPSGAGRADQLPPPARFPPAAPQGVQQRPPTQGGQQGRTPHHHGAQGRTDVRPSGWALQARRLPAHPEGIGPPSPRQAGSKLAKADSLARRWPNPHPRPRPSPERAKIQSGANRQQWLRAIASSWISSAALRAGRC